MSMPGIVQCFPLLSMFQHVSTSLRTCLQAVCCPGCLKYKHLQTPRPKVCRLLKCGKVGEVSCYVLISFFLFTEAEHA